MTTATERQALVERAERIASHQGCHGPFDENCHEYPDKVQVWCAPCVLESLAKALSSSASSETPQPAGPMVFGSWPQHCEQRAFVDGAAWWEFEKTGGTIWSSDRDRAEAEAVKRYGEPAASSETQEERPATSSGPLIGHILGAIAGANPDDSIETPVWLLKMAADALQHLEAQSSPVPHGKKKDGGE